MLRFFFFWFQNIGAAASTVAKRNPTRQISLLCLPASSAGLVALLFCSSRHPAELIGRVRGIRCSRCGWCGIGGSSLIKLPAHTQKASLGLSGCTVAARSKRWTTNWLFSHKYEVAVPSTTHAYHHSSKTLFQLCKLEEGVAHGLALAQTNLSLDISSLIGCVLKQGSIRRPLQAMAREEC